METLDWLIVGGFIVALVWISISTNRMTKSVAGFLSSERCAGRYLLTIAMSMAFCSAIGTVGVLESYYRNGIGGMWWGLMLLPAGVVLSLSGWVIYRYRQTRALTMAQFFEVRYSRNFRVFAGITAFFSGVLNCAVFPMVTANFLLYFFGLPHSWSFFGLIDVSTFHTLMLIMVGTAVTLAVSGGQITIMVTDFMQGVVASTACVAVILFVLYKFGWSEIIDTLISSENVRTVIAQTSDPAWFTDVVQPIRDVYVQISAVEPEILTILKAVAVDSPSIIRDLGSPDTLQNAIDHLRQLNVDEKVLTLIHDNAERVKMLAEARYPDMISKLQRPENLSMMNPFKLAGERDFGIDYFVMIVILFVAKVGVWQGGAGYLTAARNPHEARMGNILGTWRWLCLTLGSVALVVGGYTLMWNPKYAVDQIAVQQTIDTIKDAGLQSQMFLPVAIKQMLPPGLMGLFAIYMIGASVSTDDSSYHSWGSIFLQDVIMPFRKEPFTKEEHLRYLRLSIIAIGLIAFTVSSLWTMRDFISMWFEITGAIYIGGASCAVVGGLYWSRGTTAGAWTGLVAGSVLSVASIICKNFIDGFKIIIFDFQLNSMHIAVSNIIISFSLYVIVSLLTGADKFNMDKMLHRGKYKLEEDDASHLIVNQSNVSTLLRRFGITNEFSTVDKIIYFAVAGWTFTWGLIFVVGTVYNLGIADKPLSSEVWKDIWTVILGIQAFVAVFTAVWYSIGGWNDVRRLYRDLSSKAFNELDDGTVHGDHNAVDDDLHLLDVDDHDDDH